VVFTRTAIHNKLPEDVLLEIFDAYRRDMELRPQYEHTWNSRYGWFKLAHVCLRWRRGVLSSPSRLDMHLLLTPCKASMDSESVLRCLPRLPILLDYSAAQFRPQTPEENNLFRAAVEDRGRVHGISLPACQYWLLDAQSEPFIELKSLEIGHYLVQYMIHPATLLSGKKLRRLTLQGVSLPLSPLLSSATGLEELDLTFRAGPSTVTFSEASLFADLQRMSCLRCLTLRWSCNGIPNPSPPLPASALAGDTIPLLKLTDFIFTGPCPYLQVLVVRLAAPSLQHLDVEICVQSPRYSSIPPLCKFICGTGSQFIAVRLGLFRQNLEFSAETSPKSDHAPSRPFRLSFSQPVAPLEQLGDNLSGPLSTVEEVIVVCDAYRPAKHCIQWPAFLRHLRRVKMVQLPSEEALNVAHSFQQGGNLDLLPALGQIKVHMSQNLEGIF
jgi:hypothetical protein